MTTFLKVAIFPCVLRKHMENHKSQQLWVRLLQKRKKLPLAHRKFSSTDAFPGALTAELCLWIVNIAAAFAIRNLAQKEKYFWIIQPWTVISCELLENMQIQLESILSHMLRNHSSIIFFPQMLLNPLQPLFSDLYALQKKADGMLWPLLILPAKFISLIDLYPLSCFLHLHISWGYSVVIFQHREIFCVLCGWCLILGGSTPSAGRS